MWPMPNPKLLTAMRLLSALDHAPQSSWELAKTLGVSRPTVMRLVAELRELGCLIEAVQAGPDWAFHVDGWGVFDRDRVKLFLGDR